MKYCRTLILLPTRWARFAGMMLFAAGCTATSRRHHTQFAMDSSGLILDSSAAKSADLSQVLTLDARDGSVKQAGPCSQAAKLDIRRSGMDDSLSAFLIRNRYCTSAAMEYQDDQPLRIAGPIPYGPEVHTFATTWSSSYSTTAPFEDTWLNVGIVWVDAPAGKPLPLEYRQIHLQPGYSCLYLRLNLGTPTPTWEAALAANKDTVCIHRSGTAPDTILPVLVEHPSNRHYEYPGVTRIVEGSRGGGYIGVRCADQWCIVGTESSSDVPQPAYRSTAAGGGSMRSQIKGWFDEQHLAVRSGGSSPQLTPGPLASIIPSDSLGMFDAAAFMKDWQFVATVFMADEPVGKYRNQYKWNKDTNKVWLHSAVVRRTPPTADMVVWMAAFGPTKPSLADPGFTVIRQDHSELKFVPPTARWRWSADDEQFWVACLVGCCLVKPDARIRMPGEIVPSGS